MSKQFHFRNNDVVLLGDTHSLATTRNIVKNTEYLFSLDLIHLGDVGIGFGRREGAVEVSKKALVDINEICKDKDINFYVIRGNHDATYPELWEDMSNMFFIPQYAYGIFPNKKKALLLAGGISVDRLTRTDNYDYWKGEVSPFIEDIEPCDILLAHDAPEEFNNSSLSLRKSFQWYCDKDTTLIDDCLKQRSNVSDIWKRSGATRVFSGHFHNNATAELDGTSYRCIDINELFFLIS